MKIILSIVISKKCRKTRGKLNGAMPYNINYTGLLIYINDKQWKITFDKQYFTIVRSGVHSLLAT